jgi:hypothetical protein
MNQRYLRLFTALGLVVSMWIVATGCELGAGSMTSGQQSLPCPTAFGPMNWYWAPRDGGTSVFVSVVNSELRVPIDAVYFAPSPHSTTTAPTTHRVRVWDGSSSTGLQRFFFQTRYSIWLETSDGSSPAGQTSWLLAALDDAGRDVGFICVSPSAG